MSAASSAPSSSNTLPARVGTSREYEVGQHAGFPSSKVLLWVAEKRDFAQAAVYPLAKLPDIVVPGAMDAGDYLMESHGFVEMNSGMVLASCLPHDVDHPLRHQLLLCLLEEDIPPTEVEAPLSGSSVASQEAATMEHWRVLREDVLGAEVGQPASQVRVGHVPLIDLAFMPGWYKAVPARQGQFLAGMTALSDGVALCHNSTAFAEASASTVLASKRRDLLASLTHRLALPLHRAYREKYAATHGGMLASAVRAGSEPLLTLGGCESWTANQISFNIQDAKPVVDAGPLEWKKPSQDDPILPTSMIYVPETSSPDVLAACVISSLGVYVKLPCRPCRLLVQRSFSWLFYPARHPGPSGTLAFERSLYVSAEALPAVMQRSFFSTPRDLTGSITRATISKQVEFEQFAVHLTGALGCKSKAAAWLDKQCIATALAYRPDQSAQGAFVESMEAGWVAEHEGELERSRAERAARLCSILDFNSVELEVANGVADRLLPVQAYGVLAAAATGVKYQIDGVCQDAITKWKELRAPDVEPVAETSQERGGEAARAPAALQTASGSASAPSGRAGKKRKLGISPERLLMLTADVPSAVENATLDVAEGSPGAETLQSIIEERTALLEGADSDTPMLGTPAAPLETQEVPSRDRWIKQDQRLSKLFLRERQIGHASLRYRLESIAEAFRFYSELRKYTTRLAMHAGSSFDELVATHGVDEALAKLVVHLYGHFATERRARAGTTPAGTQQGTPASGQATATSSREQLSATGRALDPELARPLFAQHAAVEASSAEGEPSQASIDCQVWLRSIPRAGKAGRRSNAEAVQIPLFDILLQTVGRQFSQVLGTEGGEADSGIFEMKRWPGAARMIEMRMDIVRAFHEAHNGSHYALALPGICTLVLKPFWFFEVDYKRQKFWNNAKGYEMPQEWEAFVKKAVSWTKGTTGLARLHNLTLGGHER